MYKEQEIPVINKTLAIYEYAKDKMLFTIDGELKIMECERKVLDEVLREIDGKKNFQILEKKFMNQYAKEEVKFFLDTLCNERIIIASKAHKKKKEKIKIVLLGEGRLRKKFEDTNKSHYEILAEKQIHQAEVCLIFAGYMSYQRALEINRQLITLKIPSIWISWNGREVVLGPTVIPWKTTCMECHVTHYANTLADSFEENITIADIGNLPFSYEYEDDTQSVFIQMINKKIQKELEHVANRHTQINWIGAQHYYRDQEETKCKRFSPITSCKCCHGMNQRIEPYSKYHRTELEYAEQNSENAIVYQTGGFRSATKEQTKKLVEDTLNKLELRLEIAEVKDNPFYDIVPSYYAHLESDFQNDRVPFFIYALNAQGKGLNREQAYFSASFELFERLSARYYGTEKIYEARLSEMKTQGIDISYIIKQFIDPEKYQKYIKEDAIIDWVEGESLINHAKKMIPASMVFLTNTVFRGGFFDRTSSGLSSGATLEDAILQGLFEVIEHDAWLIGQDNQVVLPRIDIHTTQNKELLKMIQEIEERGYKIITRDYSVDTQIPVFRTWIINPDNYEHYATNGFGASISAEIALERSITEAIQSMIPEKDIDIDYYQGNSDDINLMYSYDSIYALSYFVKKDMQDSTCTKKMSDYLEIKEGNIHEIINIVLEKLSHALGSKYDVLFVNLTRKEIGIPTVRVIVTGDIQRVGEPLLSVSERMYEFQVKYGYSKNKPSYENLYIGAYPH